MWWSSLLTELHEFYSPLPDCITDAFRKCSERKRYSIIPKIPKKYLRNCPFFFIATVPHYRISDLSKYRLSKKMFPLSTLLKNHFIHNWEDLRKLAVMEVMKNYQKTSLVAFHLKNSSCPIHPPITVPKTESTASVPFVCSKLLGERLWWNHILGN